MLIDTVFRKFVNSAKSKKLFYLSSIWQSVFNSFGKLLPVDFSRYVHLHPSHFPHCDFHHLVKATLAYLQTSSFQYS